MHQVYPDTGTRKPEDVFNLLAIRGPMHRKDIPRIELGSPDPQSSPLPPTEFNKTGGPAGHQVRVLWGPAEIFIMAVWMSDTIFLQRDQY